MSTRYWPRWAGSCSKGHTSWQDLGTIEAYREVLDAGFMTMQNIDLTEVAAALDAENTASPPAAPRHSP
ncbi:MAG: hypothetical protein ACT4NY_14430 [Pseudonocardiales bacterium]